MVGAFQAQLAWKPWNRGSMPVVRFEWCHSYGACAPGTHDKGYKGYKKKAFSQEVPLLACS